MPTPRKQCCVPVALPFATSISFKLCIHLTLRWKNIFLILSGGSRVSKWSPLDATPFRKEQEKTLTYTPTCKGWGEGLFDLHDALSVNNYLHETCKSYHLVTHLAFIPAHLALFSQLNQHYFIENLQTFSLVLMQDVAHISQNQWKVNYLKGSFVTHPWFSRREVVSIWVYRDLQAAWNQNFLQGILRYVWLGFCCV